MLYRGLTSIDACGKAPLMTRRGKDQDNKGIPLRDMSKHAQQIGEMGRRVLGGRRTSGEGLDDRDARAARQTRTKDHVMGGPSELKVVPKKSRRRNLTCYPEFLSVISCFKKTNLDDAKCQGEIKALNECMTAAVRLVEPAEDARDHRNEKMRMEGRS